MHLQCLDTLLSPGGMPRNKSLKNLRHHEFELADACEFISSGIGVGDSEPQVLLIVLGLQLIYFGFEINLFVR